MLAYNVRFHYIREKSKIEREIDQNKDESLISSLRRRQK